MKERLQRFVPGTFVKLVSGPARSFAGPSLQSLCGHIFTTDVPLVVIASINSEVFADDIVYSGGVGGRWHLMMSALGELGWFHYGEYFKCEVL